MLKIHNGWTLAGAVVGVIILIDLLNSGKTTISLAKVGTNFITGTIKALEVPPHGGN